MTLARHGEQAPEDNDGIQLAGVTGISFARASAPPGLSGTVFIQANHRQLIGALVAAYSLRARTAHPDAFDVRIINQNDFGFFREREGQPYLRKGGTRLWRNDDLQSFTPTRFLPPELLGYEGRAVVIDPDIFALDDIHDLLTSDMQGAAIMCQQRPGRAGWDSSVMLLDCARLKHWNCREQFEEMFAFKRDYLDWMALRLEPEESIALLDRAWNSLDQLDANTKLLHNTRRRTQPWKTGLPIEFTPGDKHSPLVAPAVRLARRYLSNWRVIGRYRRHPDREQERLFFQLLRGSLDAGVVTREFLCEEMAQQRLRSDALEIVDRM